MIPRREDDFTSTVDGAAAFERWHAPDVDWPDDGPTDADLHDRPGRYDWTRDARRAER